jgi:hypothetical protein
LGGGWFWRGFGHVWQLQPFRNTYGTLTLDMFDEKTKKLIWRGIATETLSDKPEKNEKKLQEAVADMLKKFPPRGSSVIPFAGRRNNHVVAAPPWRLVAHGGLPGLGFLGQKQQADHQQACAFR